MVNAKKFKAGIKVATQFGTRLRSSGRRSDENAGVSTMTIEDFVRSAIVIWRNTLCEIPEERGMGSMKKTEYAVRKLNGIWPSDDPEKRYLYPLRSGGYAATPIMRSLGPYLCTREEFESVCRRLRNEPSWRDAPDWAVAKAQDSDGEWYWYSLKPLRPSNATGVWECDGNKLGRYLRATRGEVIGDCKQTLRLRPEEKKMEDENLKDALRYQFLRDEDNWGEDGEEDCWAELGEAHGDEFDAIVDSRMGRPFKMEDRNGWHKRGELPPIGTVCERQHGSAWLQTKIVGWDGSKIVFTTPWGGYDSAIKKPSDFSPLQTERERWIKAAQKVIGCDPNAHRHMLGQLYDSGLSKNAGG